MSNPSPLEVAMEAILNKAKDVAIRLYRFTAKEFGKEPTVAVVIGYQMFYHWLQTECVKNMPEPAKTLLLASEMTIKEAIAQIVYGGEWDAP